MPDRPRRERIVDAGLAVLDEAGPLGLTQPRVARSAGLSQSHLTYYFPTRADLVEAIAETAAARLLAGYDAVLRKADRPEKLADAMGRLLRRTEGTRVLLLLIAEADREPAVRSLIRRLTPEVRGRIARGLDAAGIAADGEAVALLHALNIGLSTLHLARADDEAARETVACLKRALAVLAQRQPRSASRKRTKPMSGSDS
jgi:AcrR family transcriptional regulator